MGKRIKEVTQITSKTTAVDIDGYDGIITTVDLDMDTGESCVFNVVNPKVRAISTVLLTSEYSDVTVNSSREVTLTGTSGTANVVVDGVNYLATFTTNLTTSATNFVTSHGATLLALGITVTADTGVLTFVALTTAFPTISVANVSGNLAGTLNTASAIASVGSVSAELVSYGKEFFKVRLTNTGSTDVLNTFAKVHFKVTHN